MKLATRTGLAALGASAIAIIALSNVAATQFEQILRERVDDRLSERAELSAAVLVAVGDRISVSELNGVIEPARILTGIGTDQTRTVEVGPQPAASLPPIGEPGLRTVRVGDEQWRLLAREVADVPAVNDRAIVEFIEPLGQVQQRIRQIRRRAFFGGLLAAIGAGVVGWLFGRRAARPLTRLQHDASAISSTSGSTLAVAERYGTPEVDDVAAALNASLAELGGAIDRREQALGAARDFAATATHELRTPLQSAMTNLDVALAGGDSTSIATARAELGRMAASLAAVHALSQAELTQPEWFEPFDATMLADLADEVISRTTSTDVPIELRSDPTPGPVVTFAVWPDGVRLALDNVVRNALAHGRPPDGSPAQITVSVVAPSPTSAASIIVDDNGGGIAPNDRQRLLVPFERGATQSPGSGLGLAVADRVANAHGGNVEIDASPSGGTRIRIHLG